MSKKSESAVVKFTPGGFLAGAEKFDKVAPRPGLGGVDLLRLDRNTALWIYGKDSIEMEEGVRLVIDANTLGQGYVDWYMSKPVQEFMAIVARGDDPISPADLPPAQGPGWTEQYMFGLMVLDGEDANMPLLYKSNTYGAKKAYADLYDMIRQRAAAGEPYNPVVKLGHESYKHSQYGLTHNPVFEVLDWMGEKSAGAVEDQSDDSEEDEAPKRGKRRSRRSA